MVSRGGLILEALLAEAVDRVHNAYNASHGVQGALLVAMGVLTAPRDSTLVRRLPFSLRTPALALHALVTWRPPRRTLLADVEDGVSDNGVDEVLLKQGLLMCADATDRVSGEEPSQVLL